MKIAYLDCHSGISGDMTLSALIDAGARMESIQRAVHAMGLVDVRLHVGTTSRKGFRGALLSIDHPPEHHHRNLQDILGLLRKATMTPRARDIALQMFERLARAEAKVHGTTIDQVHFHEVGAIDSIVDIVGVAIAWDELNIDKAYASPVPTGTGTVKIAHGIVSIPAPATAELMSDIPIAPCGLPFEMTTPTGATILSVLVDEYGPMPSMQVGRIGYGAGQRDVPDRPNLLRILIGHQVAVRLRSSDTSDDRDSICVLETNLDDLTGEQLGFAIEMAWNAGALDVFTVPIQMKKNRPGTLLTLMCRPEDRQAMENVLIRHTGTLGVRYRRQSRTIVPRASTQVTTPWGVVSGKVSKLPTGETDFSPEFDECRRIALDNGIRLVDVMHTAKNQFSAGEFHSERESTSAETTLPMELDEEINGELHQAALEDRERIAQRDLDPDLVDKSPRGHGSEPEGDEPSGGGKSKSYYRWDSHPWQDGASE